MQITAFFILAAKCADMYNMMETPTRLKMLQQQLLQLCSRQMIEEDVATIKSIIDNYIHYGRRKYEDEVLEEFGSTKDDFDEWMHDPGK